MIIGNFRVRPFVVTVQECPERTEKILKHFKDVGVEAECFGGISSAKSGIDTKWTYEIDNPGSGWRIGEKPVATWLSFYMLWSAMNVCPDKHFLQCEWDCHWQPNWRPRAEQALRDVPPDFDLLYLGSCCTKDVPKKHVKGEVWDVRYPMCGHAVIIAKKALPVMLATQRKVYAPLDISLALHTLPRLKVFTVLPRLADQFDTNLVE